MSLAKLCVAGGIQKRRVQIPAIAGLTRTSALLLSGGGTDRELVGPATKRERIAAIDGPKYGPGADHCRQRQGNERKARNGVSSGPGAHWNSTVRRGWPAANATGLAFMSETQRATKRFNGGKV
jgi:hypothetical protein